jgi:hypothetical protein
LSVTVARDAEDVKGTVQFHEAALADGSVGVVVARFLP